jgi:hypothetical protein
VCRLPLSFHNALLRQAQEERMQIQGGTEMQGNIGKCLLEHLQLARHIVFRVCGGKEQRWDHNDAPGTCCDTRLYCLCQGRAGKFQIPIVQAAPPNACTHQGDELFEFPEAVRVSTPMAS